MEREKGFEPSTFAMATRRSSQLSYSRKNKLTENTTVITALSVMFNRSQSHTRALLLGIGFIVKKFLITT